VKEVLYPVRRGPPRASRTVSVVKSVAAGLQGRHVNVVYAEGGNITAENLRCSGLMRASASLRRLQATLAMPWSLRKLLS